MQTTSLPPIEIDDSILLSLKSSKEEFTYKMKLYTAIALYQKKKISLGKAAQFLGSNKSDFINILKNENIPIFDYSKEELDEIFNNASDLLKLLK